MNIVGLKIDNLIRDKINSANFLAADITKPNFNVYYEIGYAIGRGKPIIPTVNSSFENHAESAQLTGLFDTTGHIRYENSQDLARALANWNDSNWLKSYRKQKDHAQPLYILDTSVKTDFRNYILQIVSKSSVQSRVYDPAEVPRLSLATAIGEVSASAGVILPILAEDIRDSSRHNLRAAFLAGLCHGLEIDPLIIQYDEKPAPIDFRDHIVTARGRQEVESRTAEYCHATLIRNQQRHAVSRRSTDSILDSVDIGSSAAENEFQKLGSYFIKTAEFSRAMRLERAIVAGRKGSGKSAIFFQAAEDYLSDARNVVLELRPASHNLSELRHELLGVVNTGVFDHTVAAFWQYIIYMELLLKLRERLLPKARNDVALTQKIDEIELRFKLTDDVIAGDFTSRLEAAIKGVITELSRLKPNEDVRAKVTNLLFDSHISKLRSSVVELAGEYKTFVLLLDNIDKGWPARRVEEHDVRTVQHLIEVLNKIHRELQRQSIDFRYLLFLRSDVYENLVAETSDRGKFDFIKVDWSDPKQLEHLMRERVVSSVRKEDAEKAWDAINPVLADGETAIQKMINASLRRPRFLIELVERALSFAINRGHVVVQSEDVEDALDQMSRYLVSDFGYEVRDVSGVSEDLFYRFLGKSDVLMEGEVCEALSPYSESYGVKQLVELLLWYGFLGVAGPNGETIFIYDLEYDFRRLAAERDLLKGEVLYVVNPAFLRGLKKIQ